MGQKSNLLTLKKSYINFNLNSNNSKSFVYFYKLLLLLSRVFENKGVLTICNSIHFECNKILLHFTLYYRSFKVLFFKSKRTLKKIKDIKSYNFNNIISKLMNKHNAIYSSNLLIYKLHVINSLLDKKLCLFIYNKFKRFIKTIFLRRFNLFIDFIKITSFYCTNTITLNQLGVILSQIFRYIPKRGHNKFIFFIKYLFKVLTLDLRINNEFNYIKPIKGFKFLISGRLSGKPRASSNLIQTGSVPIQGIDKNIDFFKIHSYTLLGAFGIKIWVFR